MKMKNLSKRLLLIPALIFCLIIQTSCSLPRKTVDLYNELIVAYQQAQKAAANGSATIGLGFNAIQNYTVMYNSYLSADVAKTKVYREALADYGSKLENQQKEYSGKDSSQLDLSQLVKNNATPADMALNINAYVSTFTEAPLQGVNVESLTNTQRLVDVKYNQIFAGIVDWNEAVASYNEIRNKAAGDIVARVAEYLKVKELPEKLPYYSMKTDKLPEAPSFSVD